MSFSDAVHAGKRRQTRWERYLAEMKQAVRCEVLPALIGPVYPKSSWREVKKLHLTNEILKLAAAFFIHAVLDHRLKS